MAEILPVNRAFSELLFMYRRAFVDFHSRIHKYIRGVHSRRRSLSYIVGIGATRDARISKAGKRDGWAPTRVKERHAF